MLTGLNLTRSRTPAQPPPPRPLPVSADPPSKGTLIGEAIRKHDVAAVDAMARQYASEISDIVDQNDRSPLYFACEIGDVAIVKILLENGARVNGKKKKTESTALHMAASKANLPILDLLTKMGADLNAQRHDGKTPLHLAIAAGHEPVVRRLLELGASVKIKDIQNKSPLDCFDDKKPTFKTEILKLVRDRDGVEEEDEDYEEPTFAPTDDMDALALMGTGPPVPGESVLSNDSTEDKSAEFNLLEKARLIVKSTPSKPAASEMTAAANLLKPLSGDSRRPGSELNNTSGNGALSNGANGAVNWTPGYLTGRESAYTALVTTSLRNPPPPPMTASPASSIVVPLIRRTSRPESKPDSAPADAASPTFGQITPELVLRPPAPLSAVSTDSTQKQITVESILADVGLLDGHTYNFSQQPAGSAASSTQLTPQQLSVIAKETQEHIHKIEAQRLLAVKQLHFLGMQFEYLREQSSRTRADNSLLRQKVHTLEKKVQSKAEAAETDGQRAEPINPKDEAGLLRKEIKYLRRQNVQMRRELNQAINSKEIAVADAVIASERSRQLETQLEHEEEYRSALVKALQHAKQLVDMNSKKVTVLEQQGRLSAKDQEAVKRLIREKDEALSMRLRDLEMMKNEMGKAFQERDAANSKVKQLMSDRASKKLEDAQTRVKVLEQEVNNLHNRLETLTKDKENAVKERDSVIENKIKIQTELEEARTSRNALQKELKQVKNTSTDSGSVSKTVGYSGSAFTAPSTSSSASTVASTGIAASSVDSQSSSAPVTFVATVSNSGSTSSTSFFGSGLSSMFSSRSTSSATSGNAVSGSNSSSLGLTFKAPSSSSSSSSSSSIRSTGNSLGLTFRTTTPPSSSSSTPAAPATDATDATDATADASPTVATGSLSTFVSSSLTSSSSSSSSTSTSTSTVIPTLGSLAARGASSAAAASSAATANRTTSSSPSHKSFASIPPSTPVKVLAGGTTVSVVNTSRPATPVSMNTAGADKPSTPPPVAGVTVSNASTQGVFRVMNPRRAAAASPQSASTTTGAVAGGLSNPAPPPPPPPPAPSAGPGSASSSSVPPRPWTPLGTSSSSSSATGMLTLPVRGTTPPPAPLSAAAKIVPPARPSSTPPSLAGAAAAVSSFSATPPASPFQTGKKTPADQDEEVHTLSLASFVNNKADTKPSTPAAAAGKSGKKNFFGGMTKFMKLGKSPGPATSE